MGYDRTDEDILVSFACQKCTTLQLRTEFKPNQEIADWSSTEVYAFLCKSGLRKYASDMLQDGITGEDLQQLKFQDLQVGWEFDDADSIAFFEALDNLRRFVLR